MMNDEGPGLVFIKKTKNTMAASKKAGKQIFLYMVHANTMSIQSKDKRRTTER